MFEGLGLLLVVLHIIETVGKLDKYGVEWKVLEVGFLIFGVQSECLIELVCRGCVTLIKLLHLIDESWELVD